MANEQLRSALARVGLEIEQLATQVGVDTKTVGRWLGGRTPRPRHRAKIAHALHTPEHELWPEIAAPATPADDRRELAGIYAHANDPRAPDWTELLQNARQQVDLLDYTLTHLLDTPDTVELLADKASDGCQVRILIAHPKSIWVTSLAQQLGQEPDADATTPLDRQITAAQDRLQPLIGRPGVEIRSFWAERTTTILRFDDQMLATLHLYAEPGDHAPLLHLQRHSDDGLFERFATHLDAIWTRASDPIEPSATREDATDAP